MNIADRLAARRNPLDPDALIEELAEASALAVDAAPPAAVGPKQPHYEAVPAPVVRLERE